MTRQSFKRTVAMIGTGCIAIAALAGTAAIAGSEFDLSWHRIAGGGGNSAGGGYSLAGTIGQAETGAHEGGGFTLVGGFWAGAQLTGGIECPADLSGDGVVDFSDLLQVLSAWGVCEDPGACPADLSGDGVVDFTDLLTLLSAWGPC